MSTPPAEVPVLWLVDGSHAVYRAYHALPPMSTRAGVPTHAVMGFTTMLLKAIRDHAPTHLAVCFDEDAEASRRELFADYKATRADTPEDLKPQFGAVRRVLEALRVPALAFRGYEADDLIATLTRRARAAGMKVVILSGDKDLLQLVEESGDGVRCHDSMYDKWYTAAEVEEKWGVPPRLVADLLALTGDAIDNVPGVPGVGPKTAATLLKEHGSLEGVLAHAAAVKKPKLRESLLTHTANVRRGRKLIALFDELPVPETLEQLERRPLDAAKARALFAELEFNRLLAELPRPAPTPPQGRRATAASLADVDRVVARALALGRVGLLTLTTEGAPLRDALLGLALSLGGEDPEALYLPLGHRGPHAGGDLFSQDPLPRAEVLARLKGLLEDEAVRKDGHDLKSALVAFRRAGIALKGLDVDARLASYLLDATGRDHELVVAARERAGLELPSLTELSQRTGKGKKATPLPELPAAEVGEAACALAEGARRLAETLGEELRGEPALERLYRELELPLVPVLADLELRGIALDVPCLSAIGAEVGAQAEALLAEIKQLAGVEFSPASNPQLAEVLYERLGLPVLKRGKTGPSTDQDVLEKLAEQHPLPAKILEHRQLVKLKNTYLDALPLALGADGRLHTTFDQAVAATGRLSSVNPNLQNIPIRTKLGARIREAFVPAPGLRLLSADYSQIELRVLAHVSGDPVLRESFASGEDLHARTAGETFGVPAAEVTRQQRDIAKMINYGIAYGLSAFGLAERLGLPREEAKSIIERYFARYAGVHAWIHGIVESAARDGYVTTLFGRRRWLPDIRGKNPAVRQAAERTAINTPIQGTAADLVKRAMLGVDAALKSAGLQTSMLLQIHDELVLEGPPAEVAEGGAAREIVRREMERAADLAVPLVVEVGEGATWAAAH